MRAPTTYFDASCVLFGPADLSLARKRPRVTRKLERRPVRGSAYRRRRYHCLESPSTESFFLRVFL